MKINSFHRDLLVTVLTIFLFILSIGTPVWWSGPGMLLATVVFFFAGFSVILLFKDFFRGLGVAEESNVTSLKLVVMIFAAGLSVGFCFWYTSAYCFKNFLPGTIALLLFAFWGIYCFIRRGIAWPTKLVTRELFIVVSVALMVGCYIFGLNEIQISDSSYIFTYRWDWDSHIYWASLIKSEGLPMLHPEGALGVVRQETSTHVGYLVMLGGFEQLTQTTLSIGAKYYGIFGFALLGAAGLCLIEKLRLSPLGATFSALFILFVSGLWFPLSLWDLDFQALLDPYRFAPNKLVMPSGTMYHNGTQLVAVLLSTLGFVILDVYSHKRQWEVLLFSLVLFAISGLVKPSTAIVIFPALIIIFVIKREKLSSWLALLPVLLLSGAIYFLPSILVDTVSSSKSTGWVVEWINLRDPIHLKKVLFTVSILWVSVGIIAVGFFKQLKQSRNWQWHHVACVALLGGLLFALVFREGGSRRGDGNQSWSMAGILVSASPYFVGLLWKKFIQLPVELLPGRKKVLFRVMRLAVIVVLSFQVVSGILYAAFYPSINFKTYPLKDIQMLQSISQATSSTTRFAVDISLQRQARFYLKRPMFNIHHKFRKKWFPKRLADREALIIKKTGKPIRKKLSRYGWKLQPKLHNKYEFWLKKK